MKAVRTRQFFCLVLVAPLALLGYAQSVSGGMVCDEELAGVRAKIERAPTGNDRALARFHLQNAERASRKLNDSACIRELSLARQVLEQASVGPRPYTPNALQPGNHVLALDDHQNSRLASGLSVRRELIGSPVHSPTGERIGRVWDVVIVGLDGEVFVVVGVGGYLGLGEHRVALPAERFALRDKTLYLPGATAGYLRAMPAYRQALLR